jgi:NAD(P)H-hydrate epimerase
VLAGKVHVVDIGVPPALAHTRALAEILQQGDVAIAARRADAHKHSVGHLAVIGGSTGKTGAALLVARAALRAGAGAATITTWPDVLSLLALHQVEVMSAALGAEPEILDALLAGKRGVVIGPGLGLGDAAAAVVEHVVRHFAGSLVVDADALTHFAGRPEALARPHPAILTPHSGEAARLLGVRSAEIENDRFSAVKELASRARAVVVLKGAFSLVASPDGRIVVNPTGNPALATAGSGDVLAGITGALSCTLEPFEAACAAVYVHGLAADGWRRAHGGADRGMLAGEIADYVPPVLATLLC